MRAFKTYFLILNKYKSTVLIFLAVFLGITLIMAKVNHKEGNASFQQERLDIAIVDEDNGIFNEMLKDYFGTENDIVTIDYNEQKITDALYWRRLDYVLVIPEGFADSLETGKAMELSCMKVPGYFDSAYFESELQMYLGKLLALIKSGYSVEQAGKELKDLQSEETQVTMASFVNEKQEDSTVQLFLYVPYLFIAVGVSGIGLVLLRFNIKEIKDRTECGATPMANRVAGTVAAIFVYGIMMFGIVLVIAFLLSEGSIFRDERLPWFLLNMFAMLLFGLSLGFFTGMVAKNNDVVNGIVNVTSLVLCFLGGVFVPQEFFGAGVRKVAKFVPTYWYVANNDAIGSMTKTTAAFAKNILIQSGVMVGYAVVIFAVTLVVISAKRKRIC